MTDDLNPSIDAAEDPALDQLLSTSGRFATPLDFEDRVIRTVALPLPAWALKVRSFGPWLISSATGRLTLVAMSLGLVTSVTLSVRWALANTQLMRQGLAWVAEQAGAPAWPGFRALAESAWAVVASLLPGNPAAVVAISAGVVGVSAIGLYITAGPPAFRSHHDAR